MEKIYKRVIKLTIIIFLLGVIYFGIYVYKKNKLIFMLNGDEFSSCLINETFEDEGFIARSFGKDLSEYVTVDTSKAVTSELGEFEVTYTLNYKNNEYKLIRYVRVKDKEDPKIKLKGNNPVVIELGEEYEDEGVTVSDNIDDEVKDKVQVINYVDTDKEGVYTVIYNVSDESGNTARTTRQVYVARDKKDYDYFDLLKKSDIVYMKYTDKGIYIMGYAKDDSIKYVNLCKGKKCTKYKMDKINEYYYEGEIDLASLKNGHYEIVLASGDKAYTSLNELYRLVRGRIKDKLVTFNYDEGTISLDIKDFKYEYDIVIDPGHGGDDEGAFNDTVNERKFNLEQSLYEKKRYEDHGLKVLLLREDESEGIVMGPEKLQMVTRKGYAIGYYGSVAKVSYSNHHNSNDVPTLSGWEILVPGLATTKDMKIIYAIADLWNESYKLGDKHTRIYARNYNEGVMFGKVNKEMYYFTNYYAVHRIPYDLYNTINFIFEGCYLSNEEDFKYYYENDNWKNFSEEKIKVIVESLGKKYIAP